MADKAKLNLETLKAALAHGPLNIRQLAEAMGRSSPWDLEADLRDRATYNKVRREEGDPSPFEFTIFPARERARYGFPDIITEIKGADPKRNKRQKRNADAKEQKQFWPLVAWGYIPEPPPSTVETAYDGRHDAEIEALQSLLDDAGFDYIEIKGRMVRGGSGIYISLHKDSESAATEDDSVDVDVSGVVTDPHLTPVATPGA